MSFEHRLLPILLLPFLPLAGLPGQQEESRVLVSARFAPAEAKPGDTVTLEVVADIEPGYHIYGKGDESYPSRLELTDLGGLQPQGEAEVPAGVPHESFDVTNYWVEGRATFRQKLKVPAGATGAITVRGLLHYMACTPQFCDPPAKAPFEARLKVLGGGAAKAPAADPFGGLGLQDPMAGDEGPKLSLSAAVDPSPARPGERVRLTVTVEVAPGWHVYGSAETYSAPTELRLDDIGGLRPLGAADVPPGEHHEGATGGFWLSGRFVIEQWLLVPEGTAPGEVTIQGGVYYMPCTEQNCLAPATEPFSVVLAVEDGPARAEHLPVGDEGAPAAGNGAAAQGSSGAAATRFTLLALILASIGGGLFALAMPCTYPMIPITVSFFTKQAERRGGKVLPLALAYGAGIVLIFTAIGALVALGTFGMTSDKVIAFGGHWLTNTVFALVFFAFALVLLGFVDLQPPRFLLNATASASNRGGYVGVFLMGATLVVASFTCMAPIVGTLLGLMVQSNPSYSVLGMAILGATIAIPFVALSLMPGKLQALPKSGEWMNTLKVTLGFVELAAVLKFLSNVDLALGWGVYPRELFLASWALVFLLTAMYLLGLLPGKGVPMLGVGKGRMATGLTFLLLTFYYLYGAMGYKLDYVSTALAPPYSAQVVVGKGGGGSEVRHQIVKDDYPAALRLAREQNKLLLVNFTGFL